jgi:hypothetical protein
MECPNARDILVVLGFELMDQMDLTDVYKIFHPTIAQYKFFSAAHGTFFKIDHILGHKTSLNKYLKIEITPAFYLMTMQKN